MSYYFGPELSPNPAVGICVLGCNFSEDVGGRMLCKRQRPHKYTEADLSQSVTTAQSVET